MNPQSLKLRGVCNKKPMQPLAGTRLEFRSGNLSRVLGSKLWFRVLLTHILVYRLLYVTYGSCGWTREGWLPCPSPSPTFHCICREPRSSLAPCQCARVDVPFIGFYFFITDPFSWEEQCYEFICPGWIFFTKSSISLWKSYFCELSSCCRPWNF